jgi:hypothetical protein
MHMNVTALALLGLVTTLGQPAMPDAQDIQVTKVRTHKLGVNYKPERKKDIQEARLFISRDQGQTWELAQTIPPSQDEFTFTAKSDGLYFISMQLVFLKGQAEPPDVSKLPPAQKLIIDSIPPVVRVTTAARAGDEISAEWTVDDKFPNDASTKLFYRALAGTDADWQPAPEGSVTKRNAKFKSLVAGAVVLQIVTQDLAGNVGRANKEVGDTGNLLGNMTAPPVMPNPIVKVSDSLPPPSLTGLESGPTIPPMLAPVAVEPTITPAPMTPAIQPVPAALPDVPRPIAQGSGTTPMAIPAVSSLPSAAPANPEAVTATLTKSPKFDLNYQLEVGPSGISKVDLYVTRDDGRTWIRWSTHAGTENPLRVVLDTRFNQEIEGEYGLKLVPVSGAGLSDAAPASGSAPELRVQVDTTAPMIKVFPPTADPANRNSLVLHWEATDKNFGKEPLGIEYSENPNGPWKSVAAGNDAVVPVAGGGANPIIRLANTGGYSWIPPTTLSQPKVYLRFTAWDLAGNKSEVTTPNPILVDLTKPRAKIQGISPTSIGR